MTPLPASLETLRAHARAVTARAVVPFSERPEAVVLLLEDGRTVPGVRVESASFPLTIPALQNALTSARALAPEARIVALAAAHPFTAAEDALAADALGPLDAPAPNVRTRPGVAMPVVGEDVSPFLDATYPASPEAGVVLARRAAAHALVPASDFRVGCVVAVPEGLVPGCNVEFDDWTRTLCAERNALGTVASYGLGAPATIWLACLRGHGTPCGACRQVLVEQAGAATLWMPGPDGLTETTPAALLPGAFDRAALGK